MSKVILFVFFIFSVHLQSFDSFKSSMEEKVRKLADDMTEIYAKRCDSNILKCQIKSYNSCEGTDEKTCYEQFPKPDSCLTGGASLSQKSATRFPNNVNINSLSDDERHFVCTSATLQNSFQQLNNGRNKQYGIAYIGTTLGSLRAYPTFRQEDGESCIDYDPRFRPWYVTATSGGKNIILLLDISGSMDGSRINIAKSAAKAVVNTLSNNDFIGVVTFSSDANYLGSDRITRATTQHKENLKTQIEALVPNGMTNYQDAFKKGFDMLQASQNDEYGAPCSDAQNIFLFLTDGDPTVGQDTAAGLESVINSRNSQFNITMFTYGMGSGIDYSILQSLACSYNGILFKVQDSASDSQLTTLMRSYYIYISEGISVPNPVWTQPYDDFFGFGRMVTVSMPIYYTQNNIRKILGVAGIDVVMQTFKQYGYEDETEITKKLISNMPCLKSSLKACDIQELRPVKCGVTNCTSTGTIINCSSSTVSDIFLTAVNTNADICCGLTTGAFAGIIVAIVIVIAVVVGFIVYKVKKNRAAQALQNPNQSKNQSTTIVYQQQQQHEISGGQMYGNQQQPNYPQYNNPYNTPPPYMH